MRTIPLLAVDATDVFDQIASAKRPPQQGRMQAARAEVLAAYQNFDFAAPEVGGLKVARLTEPQKEAMRHAYTVATKPMKVLRGNILNRVCVARCPFCGIGESSTIDHYLPKEQYPEFSVFPRNLVPSCSVCNTLKLGRILDEATNARMFLHPCYDIIPDTPFLVVRARIKNDALILSYRLNRPAKMTLKNFRHLRSHFNVLNLADRYRLMSLEHLGGQYHALSRAYGLGKDAQRVSDKLLELANDFEKVSGPNYWLAKLYRALSDNDVFCDGGFETVKPLT
jgi:hypothetical protein